MLAVEELRRRKGKGSGKSDYKYLLRTFPEQRKFIEDPSRLIIACTTRRAGKSAGLAERMIKTARQTPRMPILFVGKTRGSAQAIMWGMLLDMLNDAHIPFKPNVQQLSITFNNGSTITLWGADMEDAKDKLRGRKFKLVCIDEATFIPTLDEFVDAVLPCLADFKGILILSSTPGIVRKGLFWEAWGGSKVAHWSSHKWTAHENPHFENGAFEAEAQLMLDLMYGGDENHPVYRREYYGEWTVDESNLVYKYDRHRNRADEIPKGKYEYILALDIGWDDSNAITIGAYSKTSPNYYIVDSWKKNKTSIEQLTLVVKAYQAKYNPRFMVADTGGVGKYVTEEIRSRFGVSFIPADKRKEKKMSIAIMNSDYIAGNIKVLLPKNVSLSAEYEQLIKDDNGDEDKSCENHLADSALYGYVYSRSYAFNIEEYLNAEDEMEADAEREEQAKLSKDFWES